MSSMRLRRCRGVLDEFAGPGGKMHEQRCASMTYAPTSASVRQARHFTTRWACEGGLEDVADDAALVVSELAANAVIHARTSFEVAVRSLAGPGGGMRVQVRDGSATLPLSGSLDAGAMSGRGLPLVHVLAGRWGVELDPDGSGKCVWAEITPGPDPLTADVAAEELLEMWAALAQDDKAAPPAEHPVEGGPAEEHRTEEHRTEEHRTEEHRTEERRTDPVVVTVADLPVTQLLAAKSAMEDLLRELQLVLLHRDEAGSASDEVVRAAVRLDDAARAFASVRLQIRGQGLLAAERGHPSVSLELVLDPALLATATAYRDAIAEAEDLSRRQQLLVQGDVLARHAGLRRRYLDEIIAQLEAAAR